MTIHSTLLLWPAVLQAAWIGAIYALIGIVRRRAVLDGRASSTDFAPGDEPADSAAVRRHLANQFELPVLFFVVIGYLVAIGGVSSFDIWVAWGFVVSRVVHSLGSLRGPLDLRHAAFTVGTFLVAALWVSLILRLL